MVCSLKFKEFVFPKLVDNYVHVQINKNKNTQVLI